MWVKSIILHIRVAALLFSLHNIYIYIYQQALVHISWEGRTSVVESSLFRQLQPLIQPRRKHFYWKKNYVLQRYIFYQNIIPTTYLKYLIEENNSFTLKIFIFDFDKKKIKRLGKKSSSDLSSLQITQYEMKPCSLSIHLSICLSFHLPICLTFHLSIYLYLGTIWDGTVNSGGETVKQGWLLAVGAVSRTVT